MLLGRQEKSWVAVERYDACDEEEPDAKQKFKINAKTLSPTDPRHYLTIDEAHKQCDEQVMLRVRNGFNTEVASIIACPIRIFQRTIFASEIDNGLSAAMKPNPLFDCFTKNAGNQWFLCSSSAAGELGLRVVTRLKDNLPELLAAAEQRFPSGPPTTVSSREWIVWNSGMRRTSIPGKPSAGKPCASSSIASTNRMARWWKPTG